MLSKQNRLQKNREFQRVFKNSRPVSLNNLSIRIAKNFTKAQYIRFGFVVSNKIDKRATRRNTVKRQLREIAASLLSKLKPGYDIVVVLQRDFSFPYKQEEIREQFMDGLKRSSIFLNPNDEFPIMK